jgi:hypothetical protein
MIVWIIVERMEKGEKYAKNKYFQIRGKKIYFFL